MFIPLDFSVPLVYLARLGRAMRYSTLGDRHISHLATLIGLYYHQDQLEEPTKLCYSALSVARENRVVTVIIANLAQN